MKEATSQFETKISLLKIAINGLHGKGKGSTKWMCLIWSFSIALGVPYGEVLQGCSGFGSRKYYHHKYVPH